MRISDWSSDVCSSDLPLPHRILQFSIFAGLLAPGVERPAESGESEEPPKAGEQQSTDNRADDRGDQHQRGRRKFPQRPYQPAVRRMGLAGIMVVVGDRSEAHTSELQSLMRSSYAVFCLTKKSSSNNMTRNKSTI